MADQFLPVGAEATIAPVQGEVFKRLHDMGDGTVAEIVAAVGVTGGQGVATTTTAPAPITILNQASAAQTVSGASANLGTGAVSTLAVDVSVTAVAGTAPTLNLFADRLGADGVWYQMWASAQITAAGVASTAIGPGLAIAQSFGATCRLRWTIAGTTPSFTFSASIIGR